jgi:hypothetical protein
MTITKITHVFIVKMRIFNGYRGVAIFAKDFSEHPARKIGQKLTQPPMPPAVPIRPASTRQNPTRGFNFVPTMTLRRFVMP